MPSLADLKNTWPAKVLTAIWGGATLPGDVYSGKVDPLSDEGIRRATDLAGLAMGGPAISAPKGALGSGFVLDYFGQPVKILQNPSKREIAGFLNRTKYKAARRITDPDTGDAYLWDAADPALHHMVAEKLGIKADPKFYDTIGLD